MLAPRLEFKLSGPCETGLRLLYHECGRPLRWPSRADNLPSEAYCNQFRPVVRHSMATKKAAPKFSNKHIEIIADSLPQPKDKRKQELLPQILREWCDVDLQRHWSIEERKAIRERMRKIEKVRKRASDLLRALEEVDDHGRRLIVSLIVLGGREFNSADYARSRALRSRASGTKGAN